MSLYNFLPRLRVFSSGCIAPRLNWIFDRFSKQLESIDEEKGKVSCPVYKRDNTHGKACIVKVRDAYVLRELPLENNALRFQVNYLTKSDSNDEPAANHPYVFQAPKITPLNYQKESTF